MVEFRVNEYMEERVELGTKKRPFPPLQPGWYLATIQNVSVKRWEDPKGLSLQIEWQVVESKEKFRRYWQNLNVEHKDPRRELKASYMLADICSCVGIKQLDFDVGNPPRELIGKACEIEFVVMKAQPPRFPERKNWLVAVRTPIDATGAAVATLETLKAKAAGQREEYDDDDVPF